LLVGFPLFKHLIYFILFLLSCFLYFGLCLLGLSLLSLCLLGLCSVVDFVFHFFVFAKEPQSE
jgi:hypothetical protein